MKSILLSILCAASVATPGADDFFVCKEDHPTEYAKLMSSCKEKTRAKVFYTLFPTGTELALQNDSWKTRREPDVAFDVKDKYLPKFDGINFDITKFPNVEDLETLLRGWDEPGKLSLAMSGAQWPYFRKFLHRHKRLFARLYFSFPTESAAIAFVAHGGLKKKSEIPVYFTIEGNTKELSADWLQKTYNWIKGVTYELRENGRCLLVDANSAKASH